LDVQISNQKARNEFLKVHISDLDRKVEEIKKLKSQKEKLLDRMEVIQSLQGDRPEIVHIFDEIVRALPDGVYFDEIERSGTTITIKGSSESNNRVSSLMRQLDSSDWMSNPSLKKVDKNSGFGPQGNTFELTVSIVSALKKSDSETKK
jgi:type IV pilus assembly protein PilN